LRLDVQVNNRQMSSWQVTRAGEQKALATSENPKSGMKVALARNFEFSLPLEWIGAPAVESKVGSKAGTAAHRLRLRFSLWHNHLPADALPLEGWIELPLVSEASLAALAY